MPDDLKPTVPPTETEQDANPRAVSGHNEPPAFDVDAHAKLSNSVDEFLRATQAWIKIDKIENERQVGHITDQISGLRGLYKKVDDQRKAEKKPHDDAAKAVQSAFTPLLTKLKKAADALKPKVATYLAEKERREAAERAEAQRKAAAEAKAAEEQARMAESEGDLGALADAEAAKKEAEKELSKAAKPVKAAAKSSSGVGRTMSLRTMKFAKIKSPNLVFLHYRDHPKVLELLESLATAEIRSKDYDPETAPVPGIEIEERKVSA